MTIRNIDTIWNALDRVIRCGESPDDVTSDLRLHRGTTRRWLRLHRAIVNDTHLSREMAAYLVQSDTFRFRAMTADHAGWPCMAEFAAWASGAGLDIDTERVRLFAAGLPVPWLDTPKPSPEPVTETATLAYQPTRADLLRDISARLHDLSELLRALAEVTHDDA